MSFSPRRVPNKKLFTIGSLPYRHFIYGTVIFLVLLVSAVQLGHVSPYRKASRLEYLRAQVLRVTSNASSPGGAASQKIRAQILDGEDKGRVVTLSRSISFGDSSYKRLPIGSDILLTKDVVGSQYTYGDRWRIPGVAMLLLLFFLVAVAVGWWRGITSMLGLAIGVGVLSIFVLPRIITGHDAYMTCIQGAFIITAVSVYAAHGINKRTTIAVVCSLATLLVIIGIVALATYVTGTSEVINEETAGVLYGAHPVSLAGLLTGGIIIASLGALYDITTAQAAVVYELYTVDTNRSVKSLFHKGLSVGREHVAALVNTLVLVYVGVSLPSIVTTLLYNHDPVFIMLNDESVVEEIVRTCAVSLGVLLAVPLTTGLAAYVLPKWHNLPFGRLSRSIILKTGIRL